MFIIVPCILDPLGIGIPLVIAEAGGFGGADFVGGTCLLSDVLLLLLLCEDGVDFWLGTFAATTGFVLPNPSSRSYKFGKRPGSFDPSPAGVGVLDVFFNLSGATLIDRSFESGIACSFPGL